MTARSPLAPSRRLWRGLLPALLVAAWPAASSWGQTTIWTATGAGSFSAGSNWGGGSSPGVPTGATDAFVQNGTPVAPTSVNLGPNASGSVHNLTLSANNSLNVALNATLTVLGTSVSNDGALTVTAGSGNNSFLDVGNNVTLSGAGTLTLSYGDHNGSAFVQQTGGSFSLTNASNTIQGDGVIGNGGLAFVNAAAGTVDANVSGQVMTLNGSGNITNAGLLEATGGGTLQITNYVANAGGMIAANGGVVYVDGGGTVQGGTLTSENGGTLGTDGTSTLDGSSGAVVLSAGSTWTGALGTTTSLLGTITNQGNFQLNAGSGNNTYLNIAANVTLQGGGAVTLNSGDVYGMVYVQQSGGSNTLTNGNNQIQGYGVIGNGGLSVVNTGAGVVNANISGQTLTLNGSGGVVNAGLLEATGGGILQLSTAVDNLGGTVTAGSGTVNLSSTLQGGTLTGAGLQTNGTATLDGATEGALTLLSGGTWTGGLNTTTVVLGTLTNQGNIQLNAGSGNNTFLNIAADTTLQGGGTVTLNNGDNNGRPYIQQTSGGVTLTNVDNLILGAGTIGNGGLTLDNAAGGTVDASISGQAMILNGSGNITNAGLLEATGGGTLRITNLIANSAGSVVANGGVVYVDNAGTVQGGTLTSENGGTLGTDGTAILDGNSGAVVLSAGSTWTGALGTTTSLLGTITNQGNFQLLAGSGNNTFLNMDGNVTLQGGGTVTLDSGDANGAVYLQQSGGSYTLTNGNNQIQGYGVIGNGGLSVVNTAAAVVNANTSGQTLTLNGSGGVVNAGLLEATGGGVLQLATTVDNLGGTIAAGSGTVNLNSTLQGGTLTGAGFQTNGTATLDGATEGALTLLPGGTWTGGLNTTTYLLGALTNQGNIQLIAGSGNNAFLNIAANTTLQGGGTVTLDSGDTNGEAYVQQSGGSYTLTNGNNQIQGYGVIGNGGLSFINAIGGILSANVPGRTLLVNASGTVTNAGTFEADGGTLSLASALTNLGGDTLAAGTWEATNAGTVSFEGASNAIVTNSATLILDGPGSSIQTKTGAGGSYQQVEQTLTTNAGTLEVTAGRSFAASNGLLNSGVIQLGGGTLTAPALTNAPGSTLSGFGTFSPTGGVVVGNAAQLSPGSALPGQQIATLAFGTPLTLAPDGVYAFDLKNSSAPVAGTDNDTLSVSGLLSVTATPASPFSIALESINPGSGNLGPANFNMTQSYSWTLISAGSISGFNAADFTVNTSAFQNPLGGGSFVVGEIGNTLTLDFTPVPEPGTWTLMLGGLGALAAAWRRRRS